MSEDKKEFYKRTLNLDETNIGRAINTLDSIKGRWVALTEEIEWIGKFLRGVKELLSIGGWEGYSPDYSISIPDLVVKLPSRNSHDLFEIEKDKEALPKLQAIRDENIKAVYGRLANLTGTHQSLIVDISTRREKDAEKLLKRELTKEEHDSMIEENVRKIETFRLRGEY